MAAPILCQSEADYLLKLKKKRLDETMYTFPQFGGKLEIQLTCINDKEKFTLDARRRRIEIHRNRFQNRTRSSIILARLDINDSPHRNPDGEELGNTHLHLYKEGFGDRWAISPPSDIFPNTNDIWDALQCFMRFCRITKPPHIQRGLLI